jgi:hypothetical protein
MNEMQSCMFTSILPLAKVISLVSRTRVFSVINEQVNHADRSIYKSHGWSLSENGMPWVLIAACAACVLCLGRWRRTATNLPATSISYAPDIHTHDADGCMVHGMAW